jgi:hypothetical protein
MKWIWVIVLVIVGILAAAVSIEYFTVSIHALPSFMGQHHGRGHYRKRGAGAALIALVAFVGAGFLFFRIRSADKAARAANAPVAEPTAPGAEALPAESAASPELPTAAEPATTEPATTEPAATEPAAAPEPPTAE